MLLPTAILRRLTKKLSNAAVKMFYGEQQNIFVARKERSLSLIYFF